MGNDIRISKQLMSQTQPYYLGLDIGTGSIGWSVSDKNYKIIKKSGKALWGVRLFREAKTAEERRIFRTARRRRKRTKERISILQSFFSEAISAVDPGFFSG